MADLHAPVAGTALSARAGELVLTGGQVPRRPDGGVPEALSDQVALVLENLAEVLARAGSSLSRVVHLRAYVTDREALEAWVSGRRGGLGDATPAATTVLVAGLGDPRWRLEVEATAEALDRGGREGL